MRNELDVLLYGDARAAKLSGVVAELRACSVDPLLIDLLVRGWNARNCIPPLKDDELNHSLRA